MKYVFAVLFALSLSTQAQSQSEACEEVVTEFLSNLAQDKKEEVLKLVVPNGQLYSDIKENKNNTYTALLRDRFSQYQMLYNNTFRINIETPTAPGRCMVRIFGLDGTERYSIGTAQLVNTSITAIESIVIGER